MNLSFENLPSRCDVLVIGAGPAGSAAATLLAQGGLDVILVDQKVFPREKVCGDGLIPDTHAALERLGVLEEVLSLAKPVTHVSCVAPRGTRVNIPGQLAVVPRKVLDEVLCRNAVRARARMFAPVQFDRLMTDTAERVVGAVLRQGAMQREVTANWVVLATGASTPPLLAAGMCLRTTPSGMAMRAFVKHDEMAKHHDGLEFVWHARLRNGYGWIFPGPDGVFNIGAGVFGLHGREAKRDVNLRELFDAFCEVHPAARELMTHGTMLGPAKGAPLRATLQGAKLSRPGLLVTGEAAGATYAFTGEGIGKAMETGMLAAQVLLGDSKNDGAVRQAYALAIDELRPRFDRYERASAISRHPWLVDLALWRASRSESLRRRMADVLNETRAPGNLTSLRGLVRLFVD